MSAHGTFGTALNCIDGRTQDAVKQWVREKAGVQYVDMVTEAGCDGILMKGSDKETIEALKRKVGISVNAHGSKIIAIAGHHDCAGNPVSTEEHFDHIRKSVKLVQSWALPVDRVAGLWVNERWEIEEVC